MKKLVKASVTAKELYDNQDVWLYARQQVQEKMKHIYEIFADKDLENQKQLELFEIE